MLVLWCKPQKRWKLWYWMLQGHWKYEADLTALITKGQYWYLQHLKIKEIPWQCLNYSFIFKSFRNFGKQVPCQSYEEIIYAKQRGQVVLHTNFPELLLNKSQMERGISTNPISYICDHFTIHFFRNSAISTFHCNLTACLIGVIHSWDTCPVHTVRNKWTQQL